MTEQTINAAPEEAENFAALLAEHDAEHENVADRVHPGQKVTGTVIDVAGDAVFVNIGVKIDGVAERKDFVDADGRECVAVGDVLELYVTGVSAQEIRLSRSMGGSGTAALEEARDAGVPVDGRVAATCKGGYSVEVLGKTAFCPGSQMDVASVADAEGMVGRTLQFLVLRVENRGRNIVVSRRALLDRERQENLEKVLAGLNVGDTVEGRITRTAPFGAFMELAPGVEGMIHLSELSWTRVGSADEAVTAGDSVRAKVLSVSKDDKGHTRIGLSRKQAEGDPWNDVADKVSAGSVMQGRVVRVAPFGVFVELAPGIDGLVHVSELSWKRVNRPEDVVSVGDTVTVKVKDVNTDGRRISLSMRDAEGDPWQDAGTRFAAGTTVSGTVESRAQFGVFVSLAAGVTGLLPAVVIRGSRNSAELNKLDKGDSVTLVVQGIDVAARRISLAPEGYEGSPAPEREDRSWQQHASARPSGGSGAGLNIMAQALQDAMRNKKR